jgi:hypothetical protein
MRVLLTNNSLGQRAGSELYVRDVAIELMRRGHRPVAYSTRLGSVAEELRAATVPVIGSLATLGEAPDIIHGHHHYETLTALLWFPDAPAIYYCHGWVPWEEAPLRHPRILRYVAVDELCRERLIADGGIAPDQIEVILNFADPDLFPQRPPLPESPRRALAFGNEFRERTDLVVLRETCREFGIELDCVGLYAGNPTAQPGSVLADYDIVFAKARAAIEAMAVGTAVVLCNAGRIGPMVTAENFASLRPLNFGVRTLASPLTRGLLAGELRRYCAEDARAVSRLVREQCRLKPAVDRIVDLYHQVVAEAREISPCSIDEGRAASRYLEQAAPRYKGLQEAWERGFETRDARIAEAELDGSQWQDRCKAAESALLAREQRLAEIELAKREEDRANRTEVSALEAKLSIIQQKLAETELAKLDEDRACRAHVSALEAKLTSAEQELSRIGLAKLEEDQASRAHVSGLEAKLVSAEQELARLQSAKIEEDHAHLSQVSELNAKLANAEQELASAGIATIEADRAGQDRVSGLEAKLASVEQDLIAIQHSATWRKSQALLQNRTIQRFFGRRIQEVAQRSRLDPSK